MEATGKRRGPVPLVVPPLEVVQVLLPPKMVSRMKDKATREQQALSPWLRQRLIEIEKDGKI